MTEYEDTLILKGEELLAMAKSMARALNLPEDDALKMLGTGLCIGLAHERPITEDEVTVSLFFHAWAHQVLVTTIANWKARLWRSQCPKP